MGAAGPRARTTGDLRTVIVVPFRDKGTDPHRKPNAEHVIEYLSNLGLGEILLIDDGRGGSQPFNRSAAYNRGRDRRPDADVYVWHEADMIVPPDQLRDGILLAAAAPGLVVPFTTYLYLSQTDSAMVKHSGRPLSACNPEYAMADGRSVGAVGITSAQTMLRVGHWDERFEGWGYDDRAMAHAFNVVSGPIRYIDGPAHHLYHRPGWSISDPFRGGADIPEPERAATEANRRRLRLYQNTRDIKQIRDLTAGRLPC